jgi:heme A synthase
MVWSNLANSLNSDSVLPANLPKIIHSGYWLLVSGCSISIILVLCRSFLSSSSQNHFNLKSSGKPLLILFGIQLLLEVASIQLGPSLPFSALRFILANLVLGALITHVCVITWGNPVAQDSITKVRRLAIAGIGGLLVQFFLGTLVRQSHSGLACPNFPQCLDSLFPIPFTFETSIAFFHRWWGVLMLGLFVHLAVTSAKQMHSVAGPARRALGLAVAQVFLGVGTVLSGLKTESRVIHAAVGYALWCTLFYIAIRAGGIRYLWERK